MNKFSIFHTSHCGSTFLASLISKSIEVYSEPDWSHKIFLKKSDDEIRDYLIQNHSDNTVVKYSSVYCYASPHLPDQKVFIYRKLKHHMQKYLLHGDAMFKTVGWNLKIMGNHHHPVVDAIPLSGSHLHACAYLWVDRFLWMKETSNVLWIDSDDFFDDPKGTAERVCNHFQIPYTTLDIAFNVKMAGLNHTSSPINVDEVDQLKRDYMNPVDAKIVHFTHNDLMTEIIENVQRLFPMIDKQYIE